MKTIMSITALIFVLVSNATAEIHDTNAKLPDNSQITPFSEVKMGIKTVRVEATFFNQKKVLSYNQGNFCKIIYLVT